MGNIPLSKRGVNEPKPAPVAATGAVTAFDRSACDQKQRRRFTTAAAAAEEEGAAVAAGVLHRPVEASLQTGGEHSAPEPGASPNLPASTRRADCPAVAAGAGVEEPPSAPRQPRWNWSLSPPPHTR
jgi:hypothetical protein